MIDVTPIIVGVIAVLCAVITGVMIPWFKTKMTKDKQELVLSVADSVVLAVEQVFTALDGPKKKEEAIAKIKAWLSTYKIIVDDQIIDEAIESCVKKMNMQLKAANLE